MGVIKKKVSSNIRQSDYDNKLRIRRNENMCLYFHNMRITLSLSAFYTFVQALIDIKNRITENLDSLTLDTNLESAKPELNIELNENDIIHIHYKNMRMEMSIEEFLEFQKTIDEAKNKLF